MGSFVLWNYELFMFSNWFCKQGCYCMEEVWIDWYVSQNSSPLESFQKEYWYRSKKEEHAACSAINYE